MRIYKLNLVLNFLIVPMIAIYSTQCWANFVSNHQQGWHWYREEEILENKREQKKNNIPMENAMANSSKRIEADKVRLKQFLHHAILHSSEHNIVRYLKLQNSIAQRASVFAQNWQEVLRRFPELDYSISKPTNQLARHLYYQIDNNKKKSLIKKLSSYFGFYLFYRSDCRYCQLFSPTVKMFAQYFSIHLVSISLDNKKLPIFPESQFNHGIASSLKVTTVPALYIVIPKKKKIDPISFGVISTQELFERVYKYLVQHMENGS